jgi:hypothetical protein
MDALFHDSFGRQHGIQSTGNQRHRFSLLIHNRKNYVLEKQAIIRDTRLAFPCFNLKPDYTKLN